MKVGHAWAAEYQAALRDYLSGAGEAGLHRAYELGRKAVEERLSILEVTTIHHELLAELIAEGRPGELGWQVERLTAFFVECLSPFEMTQRAYQEANARLVRAKEDVESANRELEAFSYSVAHDLRAPLRSIDGYSQMLLEDNAEQLDAEGKRKLQAVSDGARNMGRLIDDLLSFSRLGRAALQPSAFDMTALAREVLAELLASVSQRRIETQVGSLGNAWGDRSLLRQVWVNLIGNAIKYTGRKEVATIEIGSSAGGREDTYWIKDNGAGFKMEHAKKLFGVFQRLHSPREFEGTGVGLALVQRLVHRHGGRVWAEAQVDQGATFSFTLPRKGEPDGDAG